MGDGQPISCRQCNHYFDGRCKAYNTVVSNADLVYMLCPASDRKQEPVEASNFSPSFVVGLGEKIVSSPPRSSPKPKTKRKGARKKKPAKVG